MRYQRLRGGAWNKFARIDGCKIARSEAIWPHSSEGVRFATMLGMDGPRNTDFGINYASLVYVA